MKGNPLDILLIEDNSDHVELILRTLRDHRMANRIYSVPDGETALSYLFRRSEFANPEKSPRPHLILLDLRLPRIDGLEVLKEIRASKELNQTPVVILTSSQAESDRARAYDFHANSYLVKPLDFAKFTQLMDDLGFYWLAWNRQPSL